MVKPATAWVVGPAVFDTVLSSVVGAAGATGMGMTGSLWTGSAIAGAASGAAAGGVVGGIYNGPRGIVQGAKYGAIGGAITGPVAAAYGGINGQGGSPWGMERVGAQSLAGGISSAAQGGSFADGAKFNFATSASRYLYNSLAKYDVNIKPGDGLASPTGNYKFDEASGRIPLNAEGNMPSIMGLNEPLVNTGNAWNDFWANMGKQGAFPGTVLNYVLPVGNGIGVLHDTGWRPYGAYFNPVTNWGTMLPAALVTYGAVLDGPTRVLSPHAIDRIRQ